MFNAFLRVLVNPVDAALFQPPNPTYSRGVRGALVDGVDLVELDPIQGFLAVQTPISDQKTCLVWVHGNACDCGEESRGFLNIATALKVVVIGVEFPGYGACPGIPNEASVDACTLAAYLYAKAKGFERIILVGRSLGSGPVTRLARKLCFENVSEFAGVILWSPIVSVKEQCKNLVGSTVSSLLADRWSPITDLTFISRPVQFITGAFDSLTPPTACARMRQASVEAPYTFLHVSETADHNAGWDFLLDVMDPIRRFVAFVSTHNVFALDDDESSEAEDESDLAIKGDHVLGGDLGDFTKQQRVSAVPSLDVKSSEQLDKNIEVLIVGCGPVGLWTAASLVHMGMKAEKILCVDKYAAFQRSHVLRIESASVEGAPESLMRLVKDEIGITRTNAIEEKLATECSKRGVKFMRPKEVVDVKAFHAAFVPSARVVICCDGSHSVGRRQLFGGLEKRFTLEYVLDCRGEIVSPSKPGKLSFTAMVDLLGHMAHVGEESVGKKSSTSSDSTQTTWPITFRLLVTGQEMQSIRSTGTGTARFPLDIMTDSVILPPQVLASINRWRQARGAAFPSETIENIRCVAVDLNCYRAKQYAATDGTTNFYLVGDAAFGVPFFRALNNGLMCGTECAKSVFTELYELTTSAVYNRIDLGLQEGNEGSETVASGPTDREAFLSKSFGATVASVNISSQISQVLAHASFEKGVGLFIESTDPLRRYEDFVRRLARKEFAVAQTKRDGLEITKFANFIQNRARVMAQQSMDTVGSTMSSSVTI